MDQSAPLYRPYRHDAAIFQIGLKPLDASALLDFGPDHRSFMAAKRARMLGRPPQFYGSLETSLPAQRELLALILTNLARHHSGLFKVSGHRVDSLLDGSSHRVDDPGREPMEIAADLTEDDYILLDEQNGDVIVIAASNAYSSTRRIVSCVGRSMRFAHELVPGLNTQLGGRIDRVLGHVQAGVPVVRYNWIVSATRDRLAPPFAQPREALIAALHADHSKAGELLSLRSERQKFLRLPETGKTVFLLHTFSDPLSTIADDAESLAAIHRLLKEYSEDRLRYSGMYEFAEPLSHWLADRLELLGQS